ncbi:MAG: hypothetical protein JOZ18_08160 [Chloroflexi bacterium]|nr:hypothetical protein [Chloroflexota bacterium]
MANAVYKTVLLDSLPAQVQSVRSVWILRLALGLITLLGAAIFFLGVSWDIQWHHFIGRDRTLIPPHVMMLCGVTISGVVAMAAVLIETIWVRRSLSLAQRSTPFADFFHGPLGAYVAGFGALNAAIAFPLDAYWHALYGIDVAIWAPFHIMIIAGMGLASLGSAYMLLSAARLAARVEAHQAKRVGYTGVLAAFGTTLSILVILLADAPGRLGTIALPGITINVFPVLAGLLGTWTFVAIVYAVSWRWAATAVCGFSFLIVAVGSAMVPPAMDFLMSFEHLSFRAVIDKNADPHLPVVALGWPGTSLIIAAVLIDVCMLVARRKGWSRRTQIIMLSVVTLLGCVPITPIEPLMCLELWHTLGIGFLVSLLIGLLGTFAGAWLGRGMGEAIRGLER